MKSPFFRLERIKTSALMFSKTKEHIMTQVGINSKITGFNFSMDYVRQYQFVDLIGTLRINKYKGFTNLEFLVNDLIESLN